MQELARRYFDDFLDYEDEGNQVDHSFTLLLQTRAMKTASTASQSLSKTS